MNKRAVVIVDLQNDYWPAGKWPLVGIENAAANAAKVIEKARADGDTVIHVRHEFPSPDAPFFIAGTEGVEINTAVQPAPDEPVIVKNYPNSFRETELKQMLDERGVEEVVVGEGEVERDGHREQGQDAGPEHPGGEEHPGRALAPAAPGGPVRLRNSLVAYGGRQVRGGHDLSSAFASVR